MHRTLIASFVVAVSFMLVGQADAQSCDPYHTRIAIDYRTYPTPETSLSFFATLNPGSPVAEHSGYVWGYDAGGWFWACAGSSTEPQPEGPRQLEKGKYYYTAYNEVFVVTGIITLVAPAGDFFTIQYVTPRGGICGTLGFRRVGRPADIVGKVQQQAIPASCPMAITFEQ